jgi:hypothetical protein
MSQGRFVCHDEAGFSVTTYSTSKVLITGSSLDKLGIELVGYQIGQSSAIGDRYRPDPRVYELRISNRVMTCLFQSPRRLELILLNFRV